jgi:hypothetical protein
VGLVSLIESGASQSTQYAGPKTESNGKLRGHKSKVKNMTNLNCYGANSCNNIERSAKHTVIW